MPKLSPKVGLSKKLIPRNGLVPYYAEKYGNDLEKRYTIKIMPNWMKRNASTS